MEDTTSTNLEGRCALTSAPGRAPTPTALESIPISQLYPKLGSHDKTVFSNSWPASTVLPKPCVTEEITARWDVAVGPPIQILRFRRPGCPRR